MLVGEGNWEQKSSLVASVPQRAIRVLGWGGEAAPAMTDALRRMGIEVLNDGLSVVCVPGEEDLAACVRLGKEIAARM